MPLALTILAGALLSGTALTALRIQSSSRIETADETIVRSPVRRDTWVSSYPGEEQANLGAERRIKLKGTQEFSLLDLEIGPEIGQRVVLGATLHLRCDLATPLRRITISTLASPWNEGDGRRYRVVPGASSFSWALQDDTPWSYPGSDLTTVINGEGQSRWHFADPTQPDPRGWQRFEVEPRLIALRRADASRGFVLLDDVGSEYRRNGEEVEFFPMRNRFCASREAGDSHAPFFELRLGEVDSTPPLALSTLELIDTELEGGPTAVRFQEPPDAGPSGVVAFEARISDDVSPGAPFEWSRARVVPRYLIPLATTVGALHELHLGDLDLEPNRQITVGIRAVDGVGNRGPIATLRVELGSPADPFEIALLPITDPAEASAEPRPPRIGNLTVSVIDPLDKVAATSGELIPARPKGYRQRNHLWSAEQRRIRLFAARNEFVSFQLILEGARAPLLSESLHARVSWPGGADIHSEVLRMANVTTNRGLVPDPLLPADGVLMTIDRDAVPGRLDHRAFLIDLYVPPEAAAGLHRGVLTLSSGERRLDLQIELTVWSFALNDELTFVPQMNAYVLPEPPREIEYYRLAQRHRTCLNRLPYGWTGRVMPAMAGTLAEPRADWSEFEQRFGPLLDGTAFADLPRGAIPVERFYLPLNENWPVSIEQGFRGGYWPEQALTPNYRASLVAATTRLTGELAARDWGDTLFEIYLNNKFMHKVRRGSWSASSAPWTFDEPVNTQDFWALRWYGEAFHQGIAEAMLEIDAELEVAYRADISRPQFQRDILDGVLDSVYYGADASRYSRMVRERQEKTGQITQLYGRPNNVDESNVQPVAWSLDAWSRGMDGVLPWQSIGSPRAWTRGEATALLYPGAPRGLPGPLPGLRLKAFRRGQQDVEYLALLVERSGTPRRAVEAAVRRRLSLEAEVITQRPDDAGKWSYPDVLPEHLWALRVAVGSMLDRLE